MCYAKKTWKCASLALWHRFTLSPGLAQWHRLTCSQIPNKHIHPDSNLIFPYNFSFLTRPRRLCHWLLSDTGLHQPDKWFTPQNHYFTRNKWWKRLHDHQRRPPLNTQRGETKAPKEDTTRKDWTTDTTILQLRGCITPLVSPKLFWRRNGGRSKFCINSGEINL